MPRSIALGSLLLLLTWGAQARAVDDDLVNFVPDGANAIAIVDVPALYASPLGQKEDWKAKHEERFLSGEMNIPPSTITVVTAAHIEPRARQSDWKAAVYRLSRNVTIEQIARMEKSPIEKIAGLSAVLTKKNAYIVAINPNTVGVMHPADRQLLARWIRRFQKPAPPAISDYLAGAFRDVSKTSQIVVALDMQDTLDPRIVRQFLDVAKSVSGKKDLDALSDLVAGLRGGTALVHVGDKIEGELRLDFSSPVGAQANMLKPLIPELISEAGASLDELENAKFTSASSTATYRFDLSRESFRRVLSLVEPPTVEGVDGQEGSQSPRTNPAVAASQKYFKSVETILKDLRRQDPSAKTFGQSAMWYDQFAKKIDNLPLLNVDQDMTQYGAQVASNLRVVSQLMRGATIKKGVLERQKEEASSFTPGYYSGGWYGVNYQQSSWSYSNNFGAVRAAQQEAIAASAKDRVQIWVDIDNATSAIRRQMVSKYSADF